MKLNKSEYRAIYDGRACVWLWMSDDGTLVLAEMGIRSEGYHPKVNIATGRVNEGWEQPDFVDVQPLNAPSVRSLVIVAPDGFQEFRDVIVAKGVMIMPATEEERSEAFEQLRQRGY